MSGNEILLVSSTCIFITDEAFIEEILQKGKEAKEKVKKEFSAITFEQLNWKPSVETWSIRQCLEHLMISHDSYFPELEKITTGNYRMNFWEKHSPFTGMFGRMFKEQLTEQVKRKMKAPKKIQPQKSNKSLDLIQDYYKNLDIFLGYISNCSKVDIDKTIITSPLLGIITYSALFFLVQHEHRHVNQAIRVKNTEAFPRK
jgi:DinB superfamily